MEGILRIDNVTVPKPRKLHRFLLHLFKVRRNLKKVRKPTQIISHLQGSRNVKQKRLKDKKVLKSSIHEVIICDVFTEENNSINNVSDGD